MTREEFAKKHRTNYPDSYLKIGALYALFTEIMLEHPAELAAHIEFLKNIGLISRSEWFDLTDLIKEAKK